MTNELVENYLIAGVIILLFVIAFPRQRQ